MTNKKVELSMAMVLVILTVRSERQTFASKKEKLHLASNMFKYSRLTKQAVFLKISLLV